MVARRRDLQLALALSLALHVPLFFLRWHTPVVFAPAQEIIARLIVEREPVPPPPSPVLPARPGQRQTTRAGTMPAPATLAAPSELTSPALPAPAASPGDAPRVDLDAAFATARQAAKTWREPMAPNLAEAPVIEAPNPVGNAIRKSAKEDCRNMAAGFGLLAIPVLLYETATEKHCKW